MKHVKFHLISLLVLVVFFSVLCPHKSHAALTKQLSYQGRLQNASGQPVANGTYSVVFSIYNVSSGGSALWTETQNVSVESGGFSAYLGSVTPLTLPFNEDYYLGIKVGSDPEMTPRLKLAIVGTSAFAFEAGKLEGKAASDFALATHTHTVDATSVQRRVSGTCAGQVMVAINQDGTVTCEADDTGGGGGGTPASTVTSVGASNVVGTSTNFAREDHAHSLPANFITDAMISNTAAIGYSKLSLLNSITNADIAAGAAIATSKISGLGSLATLNAVSGAEIQDATITFADIASNSCTSGQIVEYNGTAWICGTDDAGGGGGVIFNPTSTQTIIAGNATTTPLALKSASAPSVAMFDVQDFLGGSVVKVAPSGNLLVGNPAQIAPKLSVEDSSVNPAIGIKHTGSGTALDVWQAGSGMGVVVSLAAGNTNPLYDGDTSGTGNLLQLSVGGINKFVVNNAGTITTGGASDPNAVKINPSALQTIQPTADIVPLVIKDDAASTANLFDIQTNAGTSLVKVSPAGNLLVGNPATTTNAKVRASETGIANYAGFFEINNASSAKPAISALTNAAGAAVEGFTAGTGNAGYFEINNATNSSAVLFGYTTGTGNLLQFQKSGVDKFVVDNTGAITVGGAANAVKTNPSTTQTITAANNTTTPLIAKAAPSQAVDLFDVQNDSAVSFVKVNSTGNLLVGNPATTTAKVSAEETGTTNYAGYFKINNAANSNYAVYGVTSGTSNAGRFEISNAANVNSAVFGITAGTGPAVYGVTTGLGPGGEFQIGNVSNANPAIRGNTTGTGNLLQLQKSSVDQVVVNNSGNLLVGNPTTTAAKVSAEEAGTTNYGGYFKIANASNANAAVYGVTNGTGYAVYGNTSGSGTIFFGNTSSTGNLLQLQQAAADKFVVNNAGNITAVGTALVTGLNADKVDGLDAASFLLSTGGVVISPVGTQNTVTASAATVTPLVLKAATTPTADIFDVQDSAAASFVKVNNSGNLLVGSPATTAPKLSLEQTGASDGSYFKINNGANTGHAVGGYTNGTGNAVYGQVFGTGTGNVAYFIQNNAANSSSLIYGNNAGTGDLLQLQKSGVNKFVVDNFGSVGLVKNAAQPSACGAANDGYVALTSAYRLCVCKNGVGWVFTTDGTSACTW